ncbi:phage baseplate assembly protein V [Chitinophaga sp. sic0106]|uniref:phage baseplate assembly protein V n=1 Tax=Chitinophaga sp. sic0106 TaxID=2854785 RepID=UPI001C44F98F|nr:phage baseplate assembly protein V [Chitinophaga sp. sic0106]MBV7529042.1 phage baseplate assembly protein V [Chitinophaga sp. sic0106]
MGNLKYGVVSDVKPGFAKVYFAEDDFVTDWWPVIAVTTLKDKSSWPLNVQEHVVCMCDEHCDVGVILGCIHSEVDPVDAGAAPGKFRKVFEDGTVIEYDKQAHLLTADVKGSVNVVSTQEIVATSQTTLKAKALVRASIEAPDIQLKGNVTVVGQLTAAGISAAPMAGVPGTGKITAQADIETTGEIKAADVKAGAISLLSHKHSGVQTGTGSSGTPIP